MLLAAAALGWLPHAPPRSAGRAAALGRRGFSLEHPVVAMAQLSKKNSDNVDWNDHTATFEYLCDLAGVPFDGEAEMDFDGFVLAFEQAFNSGIGLDPDHVDELKVAVGSADDEDEPSDVSLGDWQKFHRKWRLASTMEAVLEQEVSKKKYEAAREKREDEFAAELKARQDEFEAALVAAKGAKDDSRPNLMSEAGRAAKEKMGNWFEQRAGAAELAAQYRSLDLDMWSNVTDGVGGLDDALEQIRRRVWVPLCAPQALLNELGAQRLKGLLLYGPPGCGKSLLAARLAAGLSRRPPTLVSGPEIMDKYVGGSEQQLRNLFVTIPPVPARPGDAEDTMIVAEANELHVIVLDEFDAIARKRSGGGNSGNAEGNAARDSVVNQLLALMDGVADLPVPTFVIALTNRRELVDNAILRPGRLEVHVGVGKPDEKGRAKILKIHADTMRESGRLGLSGSGGSAGSGGDGGECVLERVDDSTYDAWVESLAAKTDGFSGAALAAIVRAAVARALDRSVTMNDTQGCRVTDDDFDYAVEDLRTSSLELEDGPAFYEYGDESGEDRPQAGARQQQEVMAT